MNNALFSTLHSIGKFIPLNPLKIKPILPFYHLVSDNPAPHIKHLYTVKSVSAFEKDLDFLQRNYKFVDLHTLISSQTLKPNQCFLSFDDGLREIYDVVAPILLGRGIPATFFVNSSFIDNKALFYRYKISLLIDRLNTVSTQSRNDAMIFLKEQNLCAFPSLRLNLLQLQYHQTPIIDKLAEQVDFDFNVYLAQQQPYLSTAQIKSLIDKGFTIGAHSLDHPNFSTLAFDEQLRQLSESLTFVTESFGLKYRVFSFPFTDFGVSRRLFDVVYDSSNPLADLTFGTAGIKTDCNPRHLQRIPVERADYSAESIVKDEYLYHFLKAPFGRNVIHRL